MQEQITQETSGAKDNFVVFTPSEDQRSLLLDKLNKDSDLMGGPKCCYTSCTRCVS